MNTIKVKLPFGNEVEILNSDVGEYFAFSKKYKWGMVNEYGWPLKKDSIRNILLNQILSEEDSTKILYHMYLKRDSESGWGQYTIYVNLNKKILQLGGKELNINLTCESLDDAENLVDMLLKPNGLEVMPASIKK